MTPKPETREQTEFATAHHDYQKGLNAHAFFKVHDRAIGNDLVQDTFLKTWRYLVKGGKVHVMKAFLYHVLNRLIIDQYRKRATTSLDSLLEKGFEPSDGDSERFLDVLDGKALILLISKLPETYKRIMHMKYVRHLSIKEMSLITGKTKNAVTVQTHRGLAKLRLLYKAA